METADDYVKKPFDQSVLMLRIKKLLRTEDLLVCGDIYLEKNIICSYLSEVLTEENFYDSNIFTNSNSNMDDLVKNKAS